MYHPVFSPPQSSAEHPHASVQGASILALQALRVTLFAGFAAYHLSQDICCRIHWTLLCFHLLPSHIHWGKELEILHSQHSSMCNTNGMLCTCIESSHLVWKVFHELLPPLTTFYTMPHSHWLHLAHYSSVPCLIHTGCIWLIIVLYLTSFTLVAFGSL